MSWHNPLCFSEGCSTIRLVRGVQRASTRVAPDVPLRRDSAYAKQRPGVKVEARGPASERKRGGVATAPSKRQLQTRRAAVCGARSRQRGSGGGGADARTNAQKGISSERARPGPRNPLHAVIAVVLMLFFGFIQEDGMRLRLFLNYAGWGLAVGVQRASTRVAPDVPLRPDRAYAKQRPGVMV